MNSGIPREAENKEEPEITQEESVPSDGKDKLGEEQMKEVRNEKMDQGEKSPPG